MLTSQKQLFQETFFFNIETADTKCISLGRETMLPEEKTTKKPPFFSKRNLKQFWARYHLGFSFPF